MEEYKPMYIPAWLKIGKTIGSIWSALTGATRENRVFVLAPGSLGDMLLFYGVLNLMLRDSPQKKFVVAVPDTALAVLPPDVDEKFPNLNVVVLPFSLRASTSIYARVRRVISAVRIFRWKYQIVLNPFFACGMLSHLWCALADAKEKLWFENGITQEEDGRYDGIYTELVRRDPDMHEIASMIRIACEAGLASDASVEDCVPDIALTENERKKAEMVIQKCRKQMGRDALLVALCAGARFKLKNWGEKNFARLVEQMATKIPEQKICILMLGGQEDIEAFEMIAGEIGDLEGRVLCLNLAGKLTPREAIAVIKLCDVCAGNDTFGLHSAVVVDTPSVVVMWGGDFPWWVPWRNTELHRMVYHRMDCFGCHGKCAYADPECVKQISVEAVADEILKVLQMRKNELKTKVMMEENV